jgi:hypothetical protein
MGKEQKTSFGWVVFFIAVLVRLFPVIAAREMTIGLDDMFQYDMLARSLAAGEGFRWYGEEDLDLVERYLPVEFIMGDYDPRGVLTSFRAPGYPFFLSLIYRISGLEGRFFIARVVQAFVMASIAPVTWLLGKRLFPGKVVVGKAAAWFVSLYPYLVVYPLALATEVIFIPLVLAFMLVLLNAAESRRWQDFLLAGVLLGYAALTRSVVLGLLPFILLWVWFLVRDRRGTLILLVSVLVFVIPWTVRNTRLHGTFTSVENAMGYTLYMGYHPETEGKFQYPQSLELMHYLDDAERNQAGVEAAIGFIEEDPGRVPYLMLRKLGYFFGLERKVITYFYSNDFLGFIPRPGLILIFLVFLLPFVALMISSVPGLVVQKWTTPLILVGVVLSGYVAPHLLLLAEPRFHLMVVPLLALFTAYTWTERKQVFQELRKPGSRWKLVLTLGVIGLLCIIWGAELWLDAEKLKMLFGPEGNQLYLDY